MHLVKNIALFFGLLLVVSCSDNDFSDLGDQYIIASDLETILETDKGKVFESNIDQLYFLNGDFLSSDFAKSGKQSIKLDSNHVYGLNIDLPKLKSGQFIKATIWQKRGVSDGTLVATVKRKGSLFKYRSFYPKGQKSDWVKHSVNFVVPDKVDAISFFVFSGKKEAYFDDVKIEIFNSVPKNDLKKHLSLYIPENSKYKLDSLTSVALLRQIIPSSTKKYVSAIVVDNQDSLKIKMKLKGDWNDHIKSGKTSYRIKFKGNYSFDGLKSFSIQHPKTRNYVHEWVIHQFSDMEDVLTTDYDFLNVSVNNIDYGIYAVEEHFDKQLIESRNRREGPILKFDESGAWAYNYLKYEIGSKLFLPYFESTVISVFKQNRTIGSSTLYANFLEGQNLLYRFKNGTLKASQIFNIESLAKFYVLVELSGNNHALAWHNRRFYFNPITHKLEHILYDVQPYLRKNYVANNILDKLVGKADHIENVFDYPLLMDSEFKDKYLFYLNKMTSKTYLDSMFTIIDEQLTEYISAVQTEEEEYIFDKNEYYKNAAYNRSRLNQLDSVWQYRIDHPKTVEEYTKIASYESAVDRFFVPEISVNAYLTKLDSLKYELRMENYHINGVSVLGYTSKQAINDIIYFEKPTHLDAFKGNEDVSVIILNYKPKKLLLKVDNLGDTIVNKAIIPWPKPSNGITRVDLEQSFTKRHPKYFASNNEITFSGKIEINELIYIPSKYQVRILPGSKITFKQGGGLVVNNSFYAIGTAERPISFICEDSLSHGVTIINEGNKKEASLVYVKCSGLSNLNYKNWQLTGAINIYETATFINHLTIENNHSEDALNIIRSSFEIDHLSIKNTLSDGFDADFCTGIISKSEFANTGNDCIDFSGSDVRISDIKIINSGDKGISGGEKSTLTLENINVDGAITGVASKDKSLITGDSITIFNAEYGVAAFQKKGEYAPAKIELDELEFKNVQMRKLIDKGSEIIINGTAQKGMVRIDVDKLYERFEKK